MCSGFESIETCLEVNTYNQSEMLSDIFLGFNRKESIMSQANMVTEELTRPSFGRYYSIKPSFKITTNDKEDQFFLSLNRSLNYVIHIFDPRFYIGFYNPSLPIVKKWVQPDETAGWFHNFILTEVLPTFISWCDSNPKDCFAIKLSKKAQNKRWWVSDIETRQRHWMSFYDTCEKSRQI